MTIKKTESTKNNERQEKTTKTYTKKTNIRKNFKNVSYSIVKNRKKIKNGKT